MNRKDFIASVFAAALFSVVRDVSAAGLPEQQVENSSDEQTDRSSDEGFWTKIRGQFVLVQKLH